MRVPRVRFTVRRMMIAVAVVALLLGLVLHVQVLIKNEDDFAFAILFVEGMAVAVLLVTASVISFFIQIVRKDDAYATQLRRSGVPARSPFLPVTPDPPEPS